MEKEIVYIAELDADVDDVVAAEYLHKHGVLKEVVRDPEPRTYAGKKRQADLCALGIKVSKRMPPTVEYVFVGGALTEVARYLTMHKIGCLVMNGGFVGCNIVKNPLEKFSGKKTVRTFNFNCDVYAADKVLKSPNIGKIILIGKNVCHSPKNTLNGIWSCEKDLLEKYHVKSDKRLHDLLACREGLVQLGVLNEEPLLKFDYVRPYNTGLKGNMTEWGSTYGVYGETLYNPVLAAIGK